MGRAEDGQLFSGKWNRIPSGDMRCAVLLSSVDLRLLYCRCPYSEGNDAVQGSSVGQVGVGTALDQAAGSMSCFSAWRSRVNIPQESCHPFWSEPTKLDNDYMRIKHLLSML